MRDFCFILLCTLFISNLNSQNVDDYSDYALISDEVIKARLATINNDVVKPRFDPAVRSYINTYTIKKRDKTESMLGRTVIYFPLFEKLLAESGLPTDLKYLSVVESALNAQAVSRSGAVGLWQFMIPTGKECGLSINSTVDERKDPEKATKAAIEYLARQYKRYGNWELALAAYNGGAGRVNRAIKRGRSKNFWKIRRYLPRETRSYVPAYIAATYINHYYKEHELRPVYPDSEFQLTEMVKVYNMLTFKEIEEVTGTPEYIIEFLNPSYKRNYIPQSIKGSNLVLPQEKMAVFKNNYRFPDGSTRNYVVGERVTAPGRIYSSIPLSVTTQLYYNVEDGDDMESLAESFYCKTADIMKWNKLTSSQLRKGQTLKIYVSKDALQQTPVLEPLPLVAVTPEKVTEKEDLDWQPIALSDSKAKKKSSKSKRSKKKSKHKIKRGDSLFSIAAQYEGVTVNDLIEWNNLQPGEPLKKGKKIKVKKE
jgi:peptidoglycan lytic transglycosylase D